jgi:hypothetical protein
MVFEVIAPQVLAQGDAAEMVGATIGKLLRCRKGDIAIRLGAESAAPGAGIVIECKEDRSFTESLALEELSEARPNREAQIGVFVFSAATAPSHLPPLRRVGNDVLCVWDKDDPSTDVILTAALSVARALVIRQKLDDARSSTELNQMDDSINRIALAAGKLDEIEKWAGTILSSGEKIRDSARSMREELETRVEKLRESVAAMKQDNQP